MKLLLTFLTVLAVAASALVARSPRWTQFPNSPGGTTRNDDIYPLNETLVWSARGRDGVYRTLNGGVTWAKVLTNSSAHFRCVAFASPTRGWAGNLGPGSYDAGVTDTNVMYETFDGGEHWTNRPGFREAGMQGLCSLQVLDSQTLYGVGRVRGPAFFIKSTDGGTNWSMTNLTAAGVMGAMMDVYFRDKTNGFVVGMSTNTFADNCASIYYGRIARTTNGGATWFPVVTTTVACCYFWKMSWPSPDVCYVSLQKNPTSSDTICFYKTTDGGVTWASNGVPVTAFGNSQFYWQGIGFVSNNEGWAGGEGATSPYSNTFLHTTNGGLNWWAEGYTNSRSINRIRVLSPTLAYAGGQQLHVYRVPLDISEQPQGQWVSPGVNVMFNVGVNGNPPFTYQWSKDGLQISNGTDASLTLTNVVRSHSGNYSVVVTNVTGGSLTSSNAALRVSSPQVLAGPNLVSGGQVQVLFSDNPGGAMTSNDIPFFQVLASSNLTDWTVLNTTISVTNGRLQFCDPDGHPQRFYRVLEQ